MSIQLSIILSLIWSFRTVRVSKKLWWSVWRLGECYRLEWNDRRPTSGGICRTADASMQTRRNGYLDWKISYFQRADIALADLTMTSVRGQAVDFSVPFMNTGNAEWNWALQPKWIRTEFDALYPSYPHPKNPSFTLQVHQSCTARSDNKPMESTVLRICCVILTSKLDGSKAGQPTIFWR